MKKRKNCCRLNTLITRLSAPMRDTKMIKLNCIVEINKIIIPRDCHRSLHAVRFVICFSPDKVEIMQKYLETLFNSISKQRRLNFFSGLCKLRRKSEGKWNPQLSSALRLIAVGKFMSLFIDSHCAELCKSFVKRNVLLTQCASNKMFDLITENQYWVLNALETGKGGLCLFII